MTLDSERAIEDEFRRLTRDFDTFLNGVKNKWPSDAEIIGLHLSYYITHVCRNAVPPIPGSELVNGLTTVDLLDNTTITRDGDVAFLGRFLKNAIPSSDLGTAPQIPQVSDSLLRQSIAFAAPTPVFGTTTAAAEPLLVTEPCEFPGIFPDSVIDNGRSLVLPSDTINPTMLSLDLGPSHHRFVQISASGRSFATISSVCTTSQSSAEFGGQALSAGKAKERARSTRGATTQDKSIRQSASGEERQYKRVCLSRVSENTRSEIQKYIKVSLEDKDGDCVPVMCDLYSAIGDVDSMVQLKDVIAAMRQSNDWSRSRDLFSVASIVSALDALETLQHSMAFFRRVLLLRLLHQRDERVAKVRDRMQMSRSKHQSTPIREVKSIVLDQLTREMYPDTDKHYEDVDKRKRLRNRFFSARNWKRVIDVFDFGILALIPTGGDFRIQNQRFEKLRQRPRDILFTLLEQKGNGYLHKAAELLTPFVKAVYDGKDYVPKIRVECVKSFGSGSIDPLKVVELCNELPPGENGE